MQQRTSDLYRVGRNYTCITIYYNPGAYRHFCAFSQRSHHLILTGGCYGIVMLYLSRYPDTEAGG